MLKRKCGNCQACCVVPEIKEINKPANQSCKELGCNGCQIYSNRPEICKSFTCFWLDEYLHFKDRPDKRGIILFWGKSKIGAVVLAIECVDKAIDKALSENWFDTPFFSDKTIMLRRLNGQNSIYNAPMSLVIQITK